MESESLIMVNITQKIPHCERPAGHSQVSRQETIEAPIEEGS
jgi:hypothetical protein